MKHLYLLRHGKSSWDDPALADHERPLAPRGRKAARKVAACMRRSRIHPALVLCSPSRRTRETLELLGKAVEGEVRLEPALYAADEDELLRVLRGLREPSPSVLVIGHNPGLQGLAVELAGRGDAAQLARLSEKMPTAALASISLPIESWNELAPGAGELVAYVMPREL